MILDLDLASPISLITENVEIHNRKEAFNWGFPVLLTYQIANSSEYYHLPHVGLSAKRVPTELASLNFLVILVQYQSLTSLLYRLCLNFCFDMRISKVRFRKKPLNQSIQSNHVAFEKTVPHKESAPLSVLPFFPLRFKD